MKLEFLRSGIAAAQLDFDSSAFLAEVESSDYWEAAPTLRGHEDYRKHQQLSLAHYPKWDQKLFEVVTEGLEAYRAENPHCQANHDEGYFLLKYGPGEFYKEHSDSSPDNATRDRQLSLILFLNDDFEGGRLHFKRQKLSVEPTAGKLLLFPSYFDYAHEVEPVNSGFRYTVVTWFDYLGPQRT
jgi:hypothetical protein